MLITSNSAQLVVAVTQPTNVPSDDVTEVGINSEVEAPEADSAGTKEAKVPGVLRHLLAGKYRGVAEVRLRINFHEQLTGLREQSAKEAAADGAEMLVAEIAAAVDGYEPVSAPADTIVSGTVVRSDDVDITESTDEAAPTAADAAITEFDETVAAATDALVTGEAFALEDYFTALQSAFDVLVTSLGVALSPATKISGPIELADTDATADDAVVTSDVDENDIGASSTDSFLAALSDTFSQQLTNLLAAAENAYQLPPISEPSGKGKAFEKFLARYDELTAVSHNIVDQLSIDVEA